MTTATQHVEDRDAQLIALLADGVTPTQAAAATGLSATTIYRRIADPQFSARLAAAKGGQWSAQAAELRTEFTRSVATLRAIRDNENTHDSTRVRAAQVLCDLALKVAAVTDQDVRIAALEQAVADLPVP